MVECLPFTNEELGSSPNIARRRRRGGGGRRGKRRRREGEKETEKEDVK